MKDYCILKPSSHECERRVSSRSHVIFETLDPSNVFGWHTKPFVLEWWRGPAPVPVLLLLLYGAEINGSQQRWGGRGEFQARPGVQHTTPD